MAFTVTTFDTVPGTGSKKHVFGKYVNDAGSTGGEIVTYLTVVQAIWLQPWSNAVVANQPAVDEVLPLSNSTGTVTVVTTADESGTWYAVGY